VAGPPGGESGDELDRHRPDPEARGERLEPAAGGGPAALADGGSGGFVRGDHGYGPVGYQGHVLREGRGRCAREGGESDDGGHGGETRDRQGQLRDFARRHGERRATKTRSRRSQSKVR